MRMGSEQEFGILGGWTLAKAKRILATTRELHPCLPSVKSGVFLVNGARIYVDQGKHNEYSTPEVNSPEELVVRELAGRLLLEQSATDCDLALLCSNIDPVSGNTWGTHENYEISAPLAAPAMDVLYLHLATRIVYTGAGGVDPGSEGLVPVLSPRACRVIAPHSRQGTVRKSMVFTKPENHGAGHRLHVFSGEALLSHRASLLKYSTTALVAAALDRRLLLNLPWPTMHPVQVLCAVNRDPSMHRRIPMSDGRRLNALEIQRLLLDALARRDGDLPEWTTDTLARWAAALDELEAGSTSVFRRYDWAIYLGLLRELAHDTGIDRKAIAEFNRELRHRADGAPPARPLGEDLFRLRAAADELYIRLHIVGENSLFDRLARTGRLDPDVPGITAERIRDATVNPPPGRASMRAALIRRRGEFPCAKLSWDYMVDLARQCILPLPDRESPNWQYKWVAQAPDPNQDGIVQTAHRAFRQGYYLHAIRLFNSLFLTDADAASVDDCEASALCHARAGLPFDCRAVIAALAARGADRLRQISLELFCRIHEGLMPPADALWPLIEEGEPLVAEIPAGDYARFVFLQNKAWVLAAAGRDEDALRILRDLLVDEAESGRPRMLARTRCYTGEILRRLGRPREALAQCNEALTAHRVHDMNGDLALHSLPLLARLSDDIAGRDVIRQASHHASTTKNDYATARILCLRARQLRQDDDLEMIARMQRDISPLQSCPLMKRILRDWDAWISGPGGTGPNDYWRLA